MIKLLIIIGLAIGLISTDFEEVQVAPPRATAIHGPPSGELKYYYDEIVRISGGKLEDKKLTMGIVEHSDINMNKKSRSSIVGVCYYYLNEISISSRFLYSNDLKSNLLLVAHEMYHCKCFKSHTDKKLEDGCPSYMNSVVPSIECVQKNFDKYKEEIRQGCDLE